MRIQVDTHKIRQPVSSLTRIARWAALAWAGVIFSASSLPGSSVPGRFGTLAHFIEYAVLGALMLAALPRGSDRISEVVLAIALTSAWGVTDELHQSFVALRVADPLDWLVDTTGAVAGCLALVALHATREHWRART